jgi:hypothetical protein
VINADADQLEQLLINLIRNAVDAALGDWRLRRAGWGHRDDALERGLRMKDPACRTPPTCLFRSSRPRRAAQASGWRCAGRLLMDMAESLTVENRADRRGARAVLRLPL